MELCTYRVNITGTVQGVGFRPFIYALSQRYLLTGTVSNNSKGVEILLNTNTLTLKQFLVAIEYEYPPLASIEKIEHVEMEYQAFDDFKIIATKKIAKVTVNIPPDVSICSDCEKELFDPSNRRYRYPFITCTNCGVRYSIIYDLPYDRINTSMKFFEMCNVCEEEYSNPIDRRYHAQPIGCWECGPKLKLMNNMGLLLEDRINEVDKTVALLKDGNIVAVKGIGGYHLMCDASNAKAIANLRERKQRPTKPFAVMVKDIDMARELATISVEEEEFLTSKERPIVIVKMSSRKLEGIAPNMSKIGLFLPYTPLHLLILDRLNRPLVATSANITDEPICTSLEDLEKLQGVYDYVLEHDRDIVNGCDDSVLMVVNKQQIMLRRARGYAPMSIKLPYTLKHNVLALGANQKSTIAIGYDDQVILSPHIGDLNSIGSVEYYEKNIEILKRVYHFKEEVIVHDMHPNYESTKVAKSLVLRQAQELNNPSVTELVEVQHHYAHILGVMVEKGLEGKVFGVAFDGTGYGDDGNLWGGEFMVCDYEGYERVAHLDYFKLLGGAKAIKEPRRVALSFLFDLYGDDVLTLENATTKAFSKAELKTYFIAWEKGLNAPKSSSVGRLFDAVASLLGICQMMSFEGESAMMLEELYDASVTGYYTFGYKGAVIDVLPLIKDLLAENDTKVAISKFFHTLVEMIAVVYKKYNTLPLVLSGGVFQNKVLLGLLFDRFPHAIVPNLFPPNDGGIALGQVASILKQKGIE
ncbi:MAG: carbamoyltransferase HypF [Epsilonproteobacteria bacterium]|nr:MAG: carbamoyltransferase HypF [Campylobacterota bacterium]